MSEKRILQTLASLLRQQHGNITININLPQETRPRKRTKKPRIVNNFNGPCTYVEKQNNKWQ